MKKDKLDGDITEQMFSDACAKIGYRCEKTEETTDMFDHVDFFIHRPDGTKTSVDVKHANPDFWVEFLNVRGNEGWLYGKSELIVYRYKDRFLIIPREHLKTRAEKLTEKIFLTNKDDAYRKLYRRKNRKDAITKLNLKDIADIIKFEL